MPKLTFDGHEVEVKKGTNLIEVARQVGIDVPHYCYHPELSVVASCRMCQVEWHVPDQPPRVIVACKTDAAEGMVIRTDGEHCKKAREATLEFLLANHPLDCPICDKAGECSLQNFSYWHGSPEGRFTEPKREGLKHTKIGNHILLDQERCILCTRCTRFMSEYAGAPQLVIAGRGDRNVVTIFPGQPIESDYEGNLADLCPVGALTLEEFRFQSRVWDLKEQESICPLCDRGCSIQLETKRNRLLRVRPRVNPDNNGHFICDRGRFQLLKDLNLEGRAHHGWVDGKATAAEAAEEALFAALAKHRGKVVAVLSARLTNEEILLARRALLPYCGKDGLVYRPVPERDADGILFTGREAANEKGLDAFGVAAVSVEELRALLQKCPLALFFERAALEESEAREAASGLALIDVWCGTEDGEPPAAVDIAVPGTQFSEKEGTWINFQGRLQRLRRAQRPPAAVRAQADLLQRLAGRGPAPGEPLLGPDLTSDVYRALESEPRTLAQVPALGDCLAEPTAAADHEVPSA